MTYSVSVNKAEQLPQNQNIQCESSLDEIGVFST